ncbi:MAG: SCO family protein [Chloroflexota bacterium]|nr:SCO family protein [Chloroflexota bacterium]
MTTLPNPVQSERTPTPLSLVMISALLLGFGAAMLLISLAFLQDLRTLSEIPGLVWAFVCGIPTEDGVTLPLLVVLSLAAFATTGVLWLGRWVSRHSRVGAYLIIALILMAVIGGVYALRSTQNAAQLAAAPPAPVSGFTFLETPRLVQDFMLPASTGGDMHLSELRGRDTLLFFGYIHCPDICPTTLYEMRRVKTLLGEDADRLNILFVSVDGERDTPEALAAFVSRFNETFIGMSGDRVSLAQITPDFGLFYQVNTPDEQGNYIVDHSTPVYWLDPQGRLRATIAYGTYAENIVDMIRPALNDQNP